MIIQTCPICGENIVAPRGDKNSKVLLIVSNPTEFDAKMGVVLSEHLHLLRREMLPLFDILTKRIVPSYFHSKTKLEIENIKDDDEEVDKKEITNSNIDLVGQSCLTLSHTLLFDELNNKKIIIGIGSDAVSYLTDEKYSVDAVSGLELTEDWIYGKQFPKTRVFALVDYRSMYKAVGEFRKSLQMIISALGE